MTYRSRLLLATAIVAGLAGAALPASAQQSPQPPASRPIKPATPAAIASAKEILALKNASAMYQGAVPNIVQRTKDTLLQSNLNYQKDLNEVALTVAQNLAGREKDITEQMARIYASDFTEQELKDLVTFYKTPLGQKLLTVEPQSISASMAYMQQWAQSFSEEVNGQFRAEMRKRGKDI
jgi:hypothetical protein